MNCLVINNFYMKNQNNFLPLKGYILRIILISPQLTTCASQNHRKFHRYIKSK